MSPETFCFPIFLAIHLAQAYEVPFYSAIEFKSHQTTQIRSFWRALCRFVGHTHSCRMQWIDPKTGTTENNPKLTSGYTGQYSAQQSYAVWRYAHPFCRRKWICVDLCPQTPPTPPTHSFNLEWCLLLVALGSTWIPGMPSPFKTQPIHTHRIQKTEQIDIHKKYYAMILNDLRAPYNYKICFVRATLYPIHLVDTTWSPTLQCFWFRKAVEICANCIYLPLCSVFFNCSFKKVTKRTYHLHIFPANQNIVYNLPCVFMCFQYWFFQNTMVHRFFFKAIRDTQEPRWDFPSGNFWIYADPCAERCPNHSHLFSYN